MRKLIINLLGDFNSEIDYNIVLSQIKKPCIKFNTVADYLNSENSKTGTDIRYSNDMHPYYICLKFVDILR